MNQNTRDFVAGIISLVLLILVFYLYFWRVMDHLNLLEELSPAQNRELLLYDQIEKHSCSIQVDHPTITLRMDDVRAFNTPEYTLINEILSRNMSVTLAVIPQNLETDKELTSYLSSLKTNPRVEIAQHGVTHNESDKLLTEEALSGGINKIKTQLGVKPATYTTPFNSVELSSYDVLSSHFRVVSSDFGVLKGGAIAEIGPTIATYNYEKGYTTQAETIVKSCNSSLKKQNLCIVTIHPQEFSTDPNNPDTLSPEKFEYFKQILTGLQELDAQYATLKDLAYCEKDNLGEDVGDLPIEALNRTH